MLIEKINNTNYPLVAVLIDPEKVNLPTYSQLKLLLSSNMADLILVGGSTDRPINCSDIIYDIKSITATPVMSFPGSLLQLADTADGILLPSLLSGSSFEFAIGKHIRAARQLQNITEEIITTGYILIDGGHPSSAAKLTQTDPLDPSDIDTIIDLAIAGEVIGIKSIYLEAGSGASQPADDSIIKQVKQHIDIPIFVGGGIDSVEKFAAAERAKPNVIVIGNALEKDPSLLLEINQFRNKLKARTIQSTIA